MLSVTRRRPLSPLSSTVPSPRALRTAPSTAPRVCFPIVRCNTWWSAHHGAVVSRCCALLPTFHHVAVSSTHSPCFSPLTLRCIGPSGPVKLAKATAKPAAPAKKTTKKEGSPAEAKKTTKTTKATTKKAPAAKKTATKTATKATTKKAPAAPKAAKATKATKTTKAATTKKTPAAKANTSKKAVPKKVC